MNYNKLLVAAAFAGSVAVVSTAQAADLVRVASAQRGGWDTTLVEFGYEAGIFEKHDLDLEILWTSGGSETQQAVITGSIDVALATGVLGVISAWSIGAPLDIIGAAITGSPDLYWYVKADSDIQSMADTDGATVAYSRPGSSTNIVSAKLVEAAGTNAELVQTGGPAETLTQVMSGQIDVGWSAIPIGLDRVRSGEVRIIASGNDAPGVSEQVVRVHIANRRFLQEKPDILARFLAAYEETLDWAYAEDEAARKWAEMNNVTVEEAIEIRDTLFSRDAVALYPLRGMEANVIDAVENGRLDEPLTDEQLAEMMAVAAELHGDTGD